MRYSISKRTIEAYSFELNVANHCNLSCRSCSHLSPVVLKKYLSPDVIYRDLANLRRVYTASRAQVLGGEPLLHPQIEGVCQAIRESGITRAVRVVTNGVLLPKMADSFWNAIDEIHVSMYPGFSMSNVDLEEMKAKAAASGVAMAIGYINRFRESYSEIGTKDKELIKKISSL